MWNLRETFVEPGNFSVELLRGTFCGTGLKLYWKDPKLFNRWGEKNSTAGKNLNFVGMFLLGPISFSAIPT